MSRRKATIIMEALSKNAFPKEFRQTTLTLCESYLYPQTEEPVNENLWPIIKHIVKYLGLNHLLGEIPRSVNQIMDDIAREVEGSYRHLFHSMEEKLGFIPINVRRTRLLDSDDLYLSKHIQAETLAAQQSKKVRNHIRKLYTSGEWNGTVEHLPELFKVHEEMRMEGVYHKDMWS